MGQLFLDKWIFYPLYNLGYITFNAAEITDFTEKTAAEYLKAFDAIKNISPTATKEEIDAIAIDYAKKAMAFNSTRDVPGLLSH